MKQLLIIPDIDNIHESLSLADKFSLGFEYNDFFNPDILSNEQRIDSIIKLYKEKNMPGVCTLHGAFFDVIPFSLDPKIREISIYRIEQSIEIALKVGAKAVVFHTNYNPFLNTKVYIEGWLKENRDFWSSILEKYPDMNIYLENMFDLTPDIMMELASILSKYDNFGVCLDYAHASISKVHPRVWVEKLGKYVKHIHINDNDLFSDLHLAWGDGNINRKDFYELYDKHMSAATVLIETTSIENQMRSLKILKKEGFI